MISSDMDKKALISHLDYNYNKRNIQQLAIELTASEQGIHTLFEVIGGPNAQYAARGSWVLDHMNTNNPKKVTPHLHTVCKLMLTTKNASVHRCLLRVLVYNQIPEEYEGDLLDFCFRCLSTHETAIAVKAHAMEILYRLYKKYPEIKPEFRSLLEVTYKTGSKGEKSKSNKFLKILDKES